jgi:hypothetical protein
MAKIRELFGIKFGKLTAISVAGRKNGKAVWRWKCDCGNDYEAVGTSVTGGDTISCGCSRSSQDGLSGGKAYHSWYDMVKRCEDQKDKDYKNYGGRGITLLKEWKSFQVFIRDMGFPKKGQSLDRIDNEKGYYKENCRWAGWIQQANNRRGNRLIEHNGMKMTLSQWARKLDIRVDTLYRRLLRMDVSIALNKTIKK